jgi:molybdenum cofactor cytidylyltransferase
MKFGPVQVDQAVGSVLAHSIDAGGKRLRKGLVLDADHIKQMSAAGHTHVTVAQLEKTDVAENDAALALAQSLVPDPAGAGLRLSRAVTGRVNLIAERAGVAVLDVPALETLNRVHPMITLATVAPYAQMRPGGMVATIKIISYAVSRRSLDQACGAAGAAIRLAGPTLQTAGLIITEIAGGKSEKGRAAVETRLTALGMALETVKTVPHNSDSLSQAIGDIQTDLVLILTASATSDEMDVGPDALRRAGGRIERFGMPVDPGNLLFLGNIEGRPVIGLPGCARSLLLNGADWILSRIACGIQVTADDIAGMGVGGLLKEIPTRPQPRKIGADAP